MVVLQAVIDLQFSLRFNDSVETILIYFACQSFEVKSRTFFFLRRYEYTCSLPFALRGRVVFPQSIGIIDSSISSYYWIPLTLSGQVMSRLKVKLKELTGLNEVAFSPFLPFRLPWRPFPHNPNENGFEKATTRKTVSCKLEKF